MIREMIETWHNRRRCILGNDAKLYPGCRVINVRGLRAAIRIGDHSHVRGELLTFAHGGEISVGSYCYIGEYSKIWSAARVEIGNRVLISHNVSIFDSRTHPLSARARHEHFRTIICEGHPRQLNLDECPVIIGDDVWIGCQSVVLRGVTLGRGAIVAAGCVVGRDVPPWTMVAGNPMRVVKELAIEA